MTDTTQGQDAQSDHDLFSEVTSADTLEKFENPTPLPQEEPPTPAPPGDQPKPPPTPEPPRDENSPVPSGRFREEAEARRRAERERDALLDRIRSMQQQQPPPAPREEPKQVDFLDNPQGFVQQQIEPVLAQIRNDFQSQREAMSLNFALDKHGDQTVRSARTSLEEGMSRGDPNAWGTYNRAMQSHDPYGVIVRWHRENEQLREIGGDIGAYRKRVLEEALNDPEYRKRVMDAARVQARNSDGTFRPATPAPAPSAQVASPSLGDIGAGGGDMQVIEPSDEELFRAATRAKRR